MFIKTEDGNLINTKFVYEITASTEPYHDGTYGVVANLHMAGTRILSRHHTSEEAAQARDKYFQMN